MTDTLWLLAVMGGPLLLGGAIAYALLTRRPRSPREEAAAHRATSKLYGEKERASAAPPRRQDSPAVRSLQAEQERERREAAQAPRGADDLTEALEETFPASDPVSVTTTTTSGAPGPDPVRP